MATNLKIPKFLRLILEIAFLPHLQAATLGPCLPILEFMREFQNGLRHMFKTSYFPTVTPEN